MLFQDEPDEQSSPGLFNDEGEEPCAVLFQDEPPEQESHQNRGLVSPPVPRDAGLVLLRDEPDESGRNGSQSLFAVEPDEDDGESDDSVYNADAEEQSDPAQQALVQLNFSVLNNFLAKNLLSDPTPTAEQPKKKRRYNNASRAKAASEKQALKQSSGVLPYRAVSQKAADDWKALASVFERLLGGSPTTQRAAAYLRALADCRLPAEEPPALPGHDSGAVVEVLDNEAAIYS
eukprot:s717_g17.t1